MAMNQFEAQAIVEAAIRNDVFLMEAFMYRCHPQTTKLVELIREGAIGEVRVIQATFSFHCGPNPESRLLKNALGGGGILDVGCYCTSMARLVAGVATGKDFAEPTVVQAVGRIGATRVDDYALALLQFPGGILAELATGVQLNQENVVRIFGSEGNILVPSPWFCSREPGKSSLFVRRNRESEAQEVVVESTAGLYTIEADTVAANIERRQAPSPAMSWDDTLGNIRTLDRWRGAIGLVYDAEASEAWALPVDRRPLRVREGQPMTYGTIEGIGKRVSRLVMGTMAPVSIPYASVMYDDFFARGGTTFDTAHVYGGGLSEKMLGEWVKNRSIREEVVILAKGAHTPYCTPEGLTTQLFESLDRLQMEYVDLYMMHRDNLEVPVSEFIDVMNEHQRAGRMRTFGVSNWTVERIEAANAYARSKGLSGICAVSNNFSLARMVEPVWAGSMSASDPEFKAWLTKTQMPLLAWSAQARGFFVRGNPEDLSDQSLVNSWYCEDNFRRLERVRELAEKRGVLPTNIALAYVLQQPFPVFALVGPVSLAETRTTVPALEITLSPEEMRWLNLDS
jgi:aryl-alcohol dehydrogenase-like predicted oxidoreductase/predicted dehydrogenase